MFHIATTSADLTTQIQNITFKRPMITSHNLKTFHLQTIEDYYNEAVQNLADGKTYLARTRFKALSRKQRKDFFFHVSKAWQISAGNSLYDFFFEML